MKFPFQNLSQKSSEEIHCSWSSIENSSKRQSSIHSSLARNTWKNPKALEGEILNYPLVRQHQCLCHLRFENLFFAIKEK